MAFQVKLTRNAEQQIEASYLWHRDRDSTYADQWFRGLMDEIAKLQDKPRRFPFALEREIFDDEVRQFFYGKGRSKYRVIFSISNDTINILHLRHCAQDLLTQDDL